MTEKKEIISEVTQVYLNYGIIPVRRKHKIQFPAGTKSIKIEAVFDDHNVVYPLTFDTLQSRFFGVKGWYKTQNAKPGDFVIIEPVIPGKRYRFRLKPQIHKISTERALQQIKVSKKRGRGVSIVGGPINYGGLVYAPVNEMGVVLLFGMVFEELGMIVEEVRSAFPDATIRRFNGQGWTREFVEFEYKSSHYKQHKHPLKGCDIIVCWVHDWSTCPLEICELASLIAYLPRDTIEKRFKDRSK
ncbi:hypothetical protein KAW65_04010 [candidate division WOR-3 bacterium]|nr:hypothetical protein [candidate division WOR-3 bacterium]